MPAAACEVPSSVSGPGWADKTVTLWAQQTVQLAAGRGEEQSRSLSVTFLLHLKLNIVNSQSEQRQETRQDNGLPAPNIPLCMAHFSDNTAR